MEFCLAVVFVGKYMLGFQAFSFFVFTDDGVIILVFACRPLTVPLARKPLRPACTALSVVAVLCALVSRHNVQVPFSVCLSLHAVMLSVCL